MDSLDSPRRLFVGSGPPPVVFVIFLFWLFVIFLFWLLVVFSSFC
eukprot:Nitzschia sp. Nitz4//scaffold77_size91520//24862//25055//NITZ4_004883-RA/size91520-exonerate_est2genome-gene-0.47-mRNA-1//-1//CDS//3329557970//4766//frame0